jgi:lysophospholipase L1-like esterase
MIRKRLGAMLSRPVGAFIAALLVSGCVLQSGTQSHQQQQHWSTTWGASETVPAPETPGFNNQTLRLIAHTTSAGDQVRIKITNVFGSVPLNIGGANVALPESGAATVAGSSRIVTFSGNPSITIPIGAYVLSDPTTLAFAAQTDLAVSLFISGDSGAVTMHPLALQTSFVSTSGDFVSRDDAAPFQTLIHTWPFLAGIEVSSSAPSRSVVIFGDSITDGYKSTSDANHRWPDYLSARLVAARRSLGVVNEGIGGNRILHSAIPERLVFGPNGLSRFDRDALTITGASHIVVMLGINDIGQASPTVHPEEQVSAEEIIGGLKQFALRAHAHGIRIIGATLAPYSGAAYFSAQGEEKRIRVNSWIRTSKDLDGVIDFDAAIRDPKVPPQLNAAYDSGDHLHPNDAGYMAMAATVNLALFD